jgi:hypothetical protein
MKAIKATMALTGMILLFSLSDVFACHQGGMKTYLKGHTGDMARISKGGKSSSAFGYTTEPSFESTEVTTYSSYGTTDSTATSTNCNWRTSNIEKFFNESYLQIAEESSQGQGPHLEALAFQVGCNAQQTVLLEKAMQQNYHGVFAKEDINHSINEFYTVVNSDDQLAACWPKS